MKRPPLPTAADVMRRRMQTVGPEDDIEQAVRLLLEKDISGAPVVDADGSLAGVLTEHDCIRMLAQSISSGWPEGRVRDHMTTKVEMAAPNEDLLALADQLTSSGHRRLLVVEDGRLVGLVSRGDLLRALEDFEKKLGSTRPRSTYELIDELHRKSD
jgi:CBS domain-containing protein